MEVPEPARRVNMSGNKGRRTFKERFYTLIGVNYEHKSNLYWYTLAIPQLILLIAILYFTGGVIVRHIYQYTNPEGDIYFPGMEVLYYIGGEDIKKPTKEMKLESQLLRDTLKSEDLQALTRFHNLAEAPPAVEGTDPICYICHGDMPHRANKTVRSLLNMHTEFAACISCHIDTKQMPLKKVKFKWFKPEQIHTVGAPYGTSYDPKTGGLIQTDDRYSKITPFVTKKGVDVSLETLGDSPEARDYLLLRDTLTSSQQASIKGKFHKNVAGKGVFCDKCHTSKNSMLDFKSLGFEETRARDLTGLNIIGIVTKYKEFFIPDIYSTKPKKGRNKITKPVNKDPRSWWRDNYKGGAK